MKLVIQIPCFNEEASLPATLADLPSAVAGIDEIAVVVVDDGSTDGTADVARRLGIRHIVRAPVNQGLARAFSAGLDYALRLGADIIVNTDADGQYRGDQIERLVAPILHHEADVVVGDRRPGTLAHFSPAKRVLQVLGSWVVRQLSGTLIPDATSGFRAFSREAALRMNVVSDFTYTLETIIQAGKKQLMVTHVDMAKQAKGELVPVVVGFNYDLLEAKVAERVRTATESIRQRIKRTLEDIIGIGLSLLAAGTVIGARFLYFYLLNGGDGHIQSLILAAVLVLAGFQTVLIGLLADLIGSSRRMLEDTLLRLRRLELGARD